MCPSNIHFRDEGRKTQRITYLGSQIWLMRKVGAKCKPCNFQMVLGHGKTSWSTSAGV